MTHTIGIIGVGNIGGALAHLVLLRNLGNIVLYEVRENIAEGKRLDLLQALSAGAQEVRANIEVAKSYEAFKSCDVIIITAGVARKPGMTDRLELLKHNALIIQEISQKLKQKETKALVIVITNPIDIMAWWFCHVSGIPFSQVVGMAGILDTARFRYFLAQELSVSIEDVKTMVIGPHNDGMVPLIHYTSIAGIPLLEWLKQQKQSFELVKTAIERTKKAGIEIVSLFGTGSAFYGPAHGAFLMAQAFLQKQKNIFPCTVCLKNTYGIHSDTFLGAPVVFGGKGIEKIIPLSLTEEELSAFSKAEAEILESKKYLIENFGTKG